MSFLAQMDIHYVYRISNTWFLELTTIFYWYQHFVRKRVRHSCVPLKRPLSLKTEPCQVSMYFYTLLGNVNFSGMLSMDHQIKLNYCQ